jgi:hypothetical protein
LTQKKSLTKTIEERSRTANKQELNQSAACNNMPRAKTILHHLILTKFATIFAPLMKMGIEE